MSLVNHYRNLNETAVAKIAIFAFRGVAKTEQVKILNGLREVLHFNPLHYPHKLKLSGNIRNDTFTYRSN